ncbi:hypothetical protein [Massilia sp. Se16.2.3]|uniref:hypothetical protein n=1 Tax=Massilia sp. Se16.2.3 TaxID=2709303 RepID=UPI002804D62E|nr:hypothetical protein [Massilia sp. Se16.2.3]
MRSSGSAGFGACTTFGSSGGSGFGAGLPAFAASRARRSRSALASARASARLFRRFRFGLGLGAGSGERFPALAFGFGLFADQARQAVDQAAQALFVALQAVDLLALADQAARQLAQQGGTFRLFLLQHGLLVALLLGDFFEFGFGVLDLLAILLDLRQVGVQGGQQFRLRLRDIGHHLQVAVDPVRVISREQQLDAVFVAGDIVLAQQGRQLFLLCRNCLCEAFLFGTQVLQAQVGLALFVGEVAQRAVGVRDRLFRLGQVVGHVFLLALGAADFLLECGQLLLDAGALGLGRRFLPAAFGRLGCTGRAGGCYQAA